MSTSSDSRRSEGRWRAGASRLADRLWREGAPRFETMREWGRAQMAKPRKTGLISAIVLVGTFAGIVQRYMLGVYKNLPYPFNTFLFIPGERFGDLREVYHAVQLFRSAKVQFLTYTPFSHTFIRVWNVVPYDTLLPLLLALFLGALSFVLWRGMTSRTDNPLWRAQVVLVLTVMSYPVLYLLDRANIEMVVWLLLGAFFYFYYVKPKHWAWVFLAVAIAMKLYPVVFLVLLFADRKWRQLFGTVALVLILSVSGILAISAMTHLSTVEVSKIAVNTLRGGHYVKYGLTSIAVPHGHSLWSAFSSWVFYTRKLSFLKRYNRHYTLATLLLGLIVAYFVVRREKVPWKRVMLLTGAMITFPVVSFDYTLVHMYFPMLLFANEKTSDGLDRLYCWMFALLLVPLDLWFFVGWLWNGPFGTSAFLYAAIILTMALTVFFRRYWLDHRAKRALRAERALPAEAA